jgi:hypothetical protein
MGDWLSLMGSFENGRTDSPDVRQTTNKKSPLTNNEFPVSASRSLERKPDREMQSAARIVDARIQISPVFQAHRSNQSLVTHP